MPTRACFFLVILSTAACSVDGVDGVFGSTQSNGGASSDGGANATQNGAGGNGGDANGPTTTDGPVTNTVTGPTNGPTTVTNGPTTTTGPDPRGVNLYCDNAPCATGEVCCYFQEAKGQDFCAGPGACPDQPSWFEIGCNGSADCATGHCCGKWNKQQGWYEIQCDSNCGGGDELEMCFDDPGVCGGASCESSQALGQGYSFCE